MQGVDSCPFPETHLFSGHGLCHHGLFVMPILEAQPASEPARWMHCLAIQACQLHLYGHAQCFQAVLPYMMHTFRDVPVLVAYGQRVKQISWMIPGKFNTRTLGCLPVHLDRAVRQADQDEQAIASAKYVWLHFFIG
jgi:hypothetical protein